VTPEVLDGVYRNPVVQHCFQEGVLAELVRELHRDRPAADDLAHLAGVSMATPPGEQVTDDDQVSARRTRRSLANCHCGKGVRGIGLEALALSAGLMNRPSGALGGKLEAVDERHAGLGRESTCKADHAEAVAPVPEVPGTQLSAVQLMHIAMGLAVLSGLVAQLPEV
jgi:hypothetical protein